MVRRCLPLVLLSTLGCGGNEAAMVPASGTVKYSDGSAVAFESGTVIFQPSGQGKSASGALEKDGTFELTSVAPGDGAAPGAYKVVLQIWTNYRDQQPAIPAPYGDAATTPLEATVDADHSHFDLAVEK